jgi:hypothetical protein
MKGDKREITQPICVMWSVLEAKELSALCGKPAKCDVTFVLTIPMNSIEESKFSLSEKGKILK